MTSGDRARERRDDTRADDGHLVLLPARIVPLDAEHEDQVVRSLAAMLAALAEEEHRLGASVERDGPEAA